jgi:hypothetical protein
MDSVVADHDLGWKAVALQHVAVATQLARGDLVLARKLFRRHAYPPQARVDEHGKYAIGL